MAADLRPVQSYINLDNINEESSEMVRIAKKTVAEILAEFKKTKGIELNLRADPSSIKAVRTSIEELAKTQKKLEKSIIDLNKVRQEELKQQLLQEKISTQRKKTLQEETKLNDLNAKSKERSAKAMKVEADAATKAANAYEQLKRRYEIAANTAKRLGAEQGLLAQDFLDASNQAQKLFKELIALEKAVGQNQRKVGDYASGFSGLSNSINQISRELPAFANSVQTGFLAISNNLPIFFDEIKRANAEIKALRAQGQETQGLLARLGSAFFSLSTVLSVGVTLLTLYGKEIVNFVVSLFKGTQALDAFTEKQKTLIDSFKEGALKEAYENVANVGAAFELAKQGVISKKAALEVYNERLGETIGKATTLEEAEKLYADNTERYLKATLYRTAAQLALGKAAQAALTAEENRRKREEDFARGTDAVQFTTGTTAPGYVPGNLIDQNRQIGEAARKAAQAKRKADAIKEQEDIKKINQDIANEFFKLAAEASKGFDNFSLFGDADKARSGGEKLKAEKKVFDDSLLTDTKERNKRLSEIEELYYKDRVKFREEAYAAELAIINGQADTELQNEQAARDIVLKDAKASSTDRLNAEREYSVAVTKINIDRNKSILEAARNFETDLLGIKIDSIKKQLEQQKADLALADDISPAALLEKDNKRLTAALERRRDYLQQDSDIRLAKVEEDYQREYQLVKDNPGRLEELERRTQLKRLKIQNETNAALLTAELDYAQQYLDLLKSLGFDVVDQEAKIAAIRLKLKQQQNKALNDEDKNAIAQREKINAKIFELANAAKEVLSSAVLGVFDRRKNEIQEEIDALEEKKRKDIEVANSTIANEQDRAAAIQTINTRAAAQKEQLEQKQRKVDQDRARFERIKAIVDIGQNTAVAIAAQLKGLPATAPLIALIGAIGAAQIAAVLARPIPKYAEGTLDHPGGAAIVGDGGKSEMVVTPDGRLMLTPKIPTLMDLPEHSIVLPDAEKFRRILALQAMDYTIPVSAIDHRAAPGGTDVGLMREIIRLQQIIKNKREVQPYIKNGDIRVMMRNGQSWVDYLNSNL